MASDADVKIAALEIWNRAFEHGIALDGSLVLIIARATLERLEKLHAEYPPRLQAGINRANLPTNLQGLTSSNWNPDLPFGGQKLGKPNG